VSLAPPFSVTASPANSPRHGSTWKALSCRTPSSVSTPFNVPDEPMIQYLLRGRSYFRIRTQ
jgi:hypothetical protein